MLSTTYETILEEDQYSLSVCLTENMMRLKLKVIKNFQQEQIYDAEIKQLDELGRLREYCDNFADAKEYLKDPKNFEVNLKEPTVTIKTQNPIMKGKIIQLAILKLNSVNQQSIKPSSMQKRISSIEKTLKQIQFTLEAHKIQVKSQFFSEYVTKHELRSQIAKVRNLFMENIAYTPPSLLQSQFSYSIDRKIGIEEGLDFRTSCLSSNSNFPKGINFIEADQRIRSFIQQVRKQMTDNFDKINLKLADLDGRKVQKGQNMIIKALKFSQKYLSKNPFLQKQHKNQSQWSEEDAIQHLVKAAKVQDWESLKKQTILDLTAKHIVKLPQTLCQLQKISQMNLKFNRIAMLPADIGKMVNLTSLNVQNNYLTELPISMGGLNLHSLQISNNNIAKFPEFFSKLISLRVLIYENNNLQELPEQISLLANIQKLSIRNNKLIKLPSSLKNLIKLQWLSISDNNISALPQNFSNLKSLKFLYMSFVKLINLPQNFSNLINLNELTLTISHNSTITLSALPLSELTFLQKLSIDYYKSERDEVDKFTEFCKKRNIYLKWST